MSQFDDLPRRDQSHDIEEEAIIAFQRRLSESRVFILQGEDRKDYGTDCQIEVIDDGRATNVSLPEGARTRSRLRSGDFKQASRVWKAAMARFPHHELAVKVKRDFPQLL
jgi:hypothetical protein